MSQPHSEDSESNKSAPKKTVKKAAKKAAKKATKSAAKKATATSATSATTATTASKATATKTVAKKTTVKTAAKKTAKKATSSEVTPTVKKKTVAKKTTRKAAVKKASSDSSSADSTPTAVPVTTEKQSKQPEAREPKAAMESSKEQVNSSQQDQQKQQPANQKSEQNSNEQQNGNKARRSSKRYNNNQRSERNDNNDKRNRHQQNSDSRDHPNQNSNQSNNSNHPNHSNPSRNKEASKNNNNNNRRNKNQNNKNPNQNNKFQKREKQEKQPIVLTGEPTPVEGVLELAPKGFGFLRVQSKDWEQSSTDVFVTPDLVRKYGLRHGAWIDGTSQEGPRGPQLISIEQINKIAPDTATKLPHFDELKAINPSKRISVETTSEKFTTRIIDIIAPIGRGQRGLIVSPPRSGKTTIMIDIAEAILENHEDTMKLIVLLVDERPEEVTDFKRRLPDVEIYASSNDSGARNHCRMAELCIERAKRLVEAGEHVFILMDSITRLARAYNYAMNGSKNAKGKGFQSGGIVSGALEMPRRLFAAARNTSTAGSLTIVATALIQTNSRADEAIFQEFKGTGNMELVLDRRLAEQYLYPAVDMFKSGTRREELLIPDISLRKIYLIRRGLAGHRTDEAIERLLFFLKKFHNNAQMLMEIKG
ncbi:transcription termination factor Rho [Akkermansiaceae bacterium]|nr:transcription termination factor Rho [Akkermansiaceae bacterium]